MKIAVAGYNGFIGRNFVRDRKEDHIITLSRELLYGEVSSLAEAINGAEMVINLAGSPIDTRWTKGNKKVIEESRYGINTRLVEAVNGLNEKPELFITASAIGIYKTVGVHDEMNNMEAENYLASVVKRWEKPLENLDRRVKASILRIGIVLGREGGALQRFLKLSRAGFLPVLGSGNQMYAFIHLEDLIRAIRFIASNRLEGIFNLCSPNPVDNATFTKSLAKTSGTKLIIRVPTIILKAGMGEAHIMVTEGPHVLPSRLTGEGFNFNFPDIDNALQNLVRIH